MSHDLGGWSASPTKSRQLFATCGCCTRLHVWGQEVQQSSCVLSPSRSAQNFCDVVPNIHQDNRMEMEKKSLVAQRAWESLCYPSAGLDPMLVWLSRGPKQQINTRILYIIVSGIHSGSGLRARTWDPCVDVVFWHHAKLSETEKGQSSDEARHVSPLLRPL